MRQHEADLKVFPRPSNKRSRDHVAHMSVVVVEPALAMHETRSYALGSPR